MRTLEALDDPGGPPLGLDAVKAHLRIEGEGEDEAVRLIAAAAAARAESFARLGLSARRMRLTLDGFPPGGRPAQLPRPPVPEVESVLYLGPDGAQRELPADGYRLDAARGRIAPAGGAWPAAAPAPGSVAVTYRGGYARAADVPAPVLQAVLLIAGSLYEHPDGEGPGLPAAARSLLAPYRRIAA